MNMSSSLLHYKDGLLLQSNIEKVMQSILPPKQALVFSYEASLALLWDNWVTSSPFIANPLLKKGPFGEWALMFAIHKDDPLGLSKETPNSDIVYLKCFLNAKLKGFEKTKYEFSLPFKQSLDEVFPQDFTHQLTQLGKIIHMIAEKNVIDAFDTYKKEIVFDLNIKEEPTKVSRLIEKYPTCWSYLLEYILTKETENTTNPNPRSLCVKKKM